MTLDDLKNNWTDTPEYHAHIHESFIELVNSNPELCKHRDYVEQNIWGFGERSFWWLWKILLAELPENPGLLEIGVFRAATLSLWKLLRPDAKVFGITPLDTSGDVWESDYAADIAKIHDDFGLPQPFIIKGRSDEENVVVKANLLQYDVIYVDGDHSLSGALFDLRTYAPMIKPGGYLVVDDAACRTSQPFGYFQGIQPVCDALETWEKEQADFEFQFNVVHLMIFKRK